MLKKIVFPLSIVLLLTACGGGGNSQTTKDKAIEKITAFAEDENKPAPSLQDYIDAGVTGVTSDNLGDLNALVDNLEAEDVDTTAELDALTSQLGINISPIVNAGTDKTVEVNKSITLTGTATDADGSIVSFEWKRGVDILATTLSFDYTPTVTGIDTLTFTATDNDGGSASDTIQVVVTDASIVPNQAPTADAGLDKSVEINKTITLTGSGSDSDGTIESYEWKKGSTVLATTASFSYTPTVVGTDTLLLTVKDNDDATATDTVRIIVTPVPEIPNQAPIANNTTANTNEDAAKDIVLTASDADGDNLVYVKFTNPQHGSVSFNDNVATYTPSADYNGTDSFTYKVNDGSIDSNIATVTISVTAKNDAPVANSITTNTPKNIAKSISLNAHDIDGDTLAYQTVLAPIHGSVSIVGNVATYTPENNYSGVDSFTYKANDGTENSNIATVNITIDAVNTEPVAEAISASTNEDTNKSITLVGTDIDGDSLTYTKVTDPSHGTVSFAGNTASYMPEPNYSGTDSFTYLVNDNTVDSNTATVTINVIAVNDAPTANPTTATTDEDTAKAITLTGADPEGSSLNYSVVTQPSNGTLNIVGSVANYTPTENYNGADSFSYQVNDGGLDSNIATVNISISAVNDLPVADSINATAQEDSTKAITLIGNDLDNDSLTFVKVSDPVHGTVSLAGNVATYTPEANYNGADSFSYKVNDGTGDSNIATVTLEVEAANDAPTAEAVSASTNEDTNKSITLVGTDTDGDSLTYTKVTDPSHGTVSFSGNTASYTPEPNYSGADSFTYLVNDNTVNSNTATVTINVIAVNDAPTANPTTATTDEDTAKAITLTGADPEGSSLTYSVVTQPSNGIVNIVGSVANYTPNENHNGTDSFSFKVNDGELDSNIATVNISITAKNDLPVADSINATAQEDSTKAITLTATDLDNDSLTFVKVSDPANGTVSLAGNVATYTPEANYNGADSFSYKANDGTGDSNTATVTINVIAVNDVPKANEISITTDESTPIDIILSGVDTEGSLLTYQIQTVPRMGALSTINGNRVTYTPTSGQHGDDSFTFVVNDGSVDSIPAIVNIMVNSTPEVPPVRDPLEEDVVTSSTGETLVRSEIIINKKDSAAHEQIISLINENGWELVGYIELFGRYEIDIKSNEENALYSALATAKASTFVDFALANSMSKLNAEFYTNDKYYNQEYESNAWALSSINAPQAWELLSNEGVRPGVKVGIIDGGFKFGHEDLEFSKILTSTSTIDGYTDGSRLYDLCYGKSVDECKGPNHGMHVAGIISATGDNGVGIVGAAYKNKENPLGYILSFVGDAQVTNQNILLGFSLLANNGARVINFSIGDMECKEEDNKSCALLPDESGFKQRVEEFSKNIEKVIDNDDILFVQSSGNEGEYSFGEGLAPTDINGFFSSVASDDFVCTNSSDIECASRIEKVRGNSLIVGAYYLDSLGNKIIAPYTQLPKLGSASEIPFILAPGGFSAGRRVWSLNYNDNYHYMFMSGTSMAAPHVTGVAALILQADPTLTASKVQRIILDSADVIDGYKYLNAERAVDMAINKVKFDWDKDGIPDLWEIEHSLDKKNPADALEDPDKDDSSNLREYIDGTNPNDASSNINLYEKTGVFSKDGRVVLVVGIDPTIISSSAENYRITINFFDAKWTDNKFESYSVDINPKQSIYEIDITELFTTVDKPSNYDINLNYHNTETNADTFLRLYYGFYDYANEQENSSIAFKTLNDTLLGQDSIHGDNVFRNVDGHESKHLLNTTTHRITDLDKALNNLTEIPVEWKMGSYNHNSNHDQSTDTRQPLLLVHGWQGSLGQTSPSKMLRHENSEFEYWHNFISYYLGTKSLNEKYKIYLYHYPSYKHVTYNARILKDLLDELKVNNNTPLGKALNNQGIVIQSHSMGGMISRTLVEEHKGLGQNAEKLIKLITLDTPHHGTPSALQAHEIIDWGDGIAKDLSTPGAVDLMWDNYDLHYDCTSQQTNLCGVLEQSIGIETGAIDGIGDDSRETRLDEVTSKGLFDQYYYNLLTPLLSASELPYTAKELRLNPYLLYLNKKLESGYLSIAKSKYIFYIAHSSRFPNGSQDPSYTQEVNELLDAIDGQAGMAINSSFLRGIGYSAGGAEPVASAFLSKSIVYDGATRLSHLLSNNPSYLPEKLITIDNDGHENNYNIPYRYFWDYNHDYIFQGVYTSLGDWDKYIDQSVTNIINSCTDSNFDDFGILGCSNYRKYYYDYVIDYINTGTNSVTDHASKRTSEAFNPLKTEPVFLMIGKDLKDALGLPSVYAGLDKSTYETLSVSLDLPIASSPDIDNAIIKYEWTEGNVVHCTSQTAIACTIDGLAEGIHTITLTVTDDVDLSASDTVNIQVLAADTDTDHDLMPDVWELQYALDPENPNKPYLNPLVDDAGLDVDGDGVSNYQEYLDSTDPTDPNSFAGSVRYRLNDTGITRCANQTQNNLACPVSTHPNQDAQTGRDATHNDNTDGHAGFSFTKISSTGLELPISATQWSCVKDNVTGLMWEVKASDGGLHDKNKKYTWYNPDFSLNGGSAGVQSSTIIQETYSGSGIAIIKVDNFGIEEDVECSIYGDEMSLAMVGGVMCSDLVVQNNTHSFSNEVNATNLCGTSEWRLPTRPELRSIQDYGIAYPGPTIDTAYFPNTIPRLYWTSSPFGQYAWGFTFIDGIEMKINKTRLTYVRLVH